MKSLSIVDAPEIAEFISKFCLPRDIYLYISTVFRGGGHFLINDNFSALVVVERINKAEAEIHIYVEEKTRGKKAISFVRDCKDWARRNTNLESVYNKVPVNNDRLKMFMCMLGGTVYKQDDHEIVYITKIKEN